MADLIGDIDFSRGDSYPLGIRLKDKATKEYVNITGYSFLLTVDPSKTPIDSANNIFQVIGEVDEDQVNNIGRVSFTPSETDTDNVGKFYYDIQYIDTQGHKKTFVKGFKFTIGQDITK